MNELTKYLWPLVKILFIPYALLMFLLVYRINYVIYAPGGITEVEALISVDYDVPDSEGSFSSTYVVSFSKPTFFQFIVSDFSRYNRVYILSESYAHYTDTERRVISYIQKYTSVDASIKVAYEVASLNNNEIVFDESSTYEIVVVYGKDAELTNYNAVGLADRFVSMMGDNGILVEDYTLILNHMTAGLMYDFTFETEEGTTYEVSISADDYINGYLDLNAYTLIDETHIYPRFEETDSNIGGPSGGLMQTLAIYDMLVDEDMTKGYKIAGTGTISYAGNVGQIGGMTQKIATAYLNKVDIFFVPGVETSNYAEALAACEKFGIDPEDWLIPVETFAEAVSFLEGLEPNE